MIYCESQESGKPQPGSKTKRVFIGGLKTTTTSETLLEYFSQYGHVEFVDLPEDKGSQRRRGFGYVAFDDYDPVDKVTSELLLVEFPLLAVEVNEYTWLKLGCVACDRIDSHVCHELTFKFCISSPFFMGYWADERHGNPPPR